MSIDYGNLGEIIATIIVVVSGAYCSGRVHQWYRHCMDRDEAFRAGYNHASHALFYLTARRHGTPSTPAGGSPDFTTD